ncbi:hypothetical protein V6N13_146311 [Hibiscus sabdariffa]|uniref:Uncharacterized protein n=1 Tax=Hibiscus sabdariffa TaxID=183260 RepID=A0ABR2TT15_9ROSI
MGEAADLRVLMVHNQGQDKGNLRMPSIDEILMAPKIPKVVKTDTYSTAAGGENVKRPRGRPAGSKKKTKPSIIVTRDSANVIRAHAIEVS